MWIRYKCVSGNLTIICDMRFSSILLSLVKELFDAILSLISFRRVRPTEV